MTNDTITFSRENKLCELYIDLLKSNKYIIEDENCKKIDFKSLQTLLFKQDTISYIYSDIKPDTVVISDVGLSCSQISKILYVNDKKNRIRIGAYFEIYNSETGEYIETKKLWIRLYK